MRLADELRRAELPGAAEAEDRAWRVVRSAWSAREPVQRRRRNVRPVVALAAGLAVVAGAITSPGRAVLGSIRDQVRGEQHAAPALFSLPTGGRLLVESAAGPWIVQPDGSKRLLGNWRQASWSPHGLFVAVSRRNELAAVEADGHVHWTLARPDILFPRWGGSRTDTRVAYLSGSRLHVVVGNGLRDRDACGEPAAAKVAPAWRAGLPHRLAYADVRGRVSVLDTDACSLRWRSARFDGVRQLAWSPDGRFVLVRMAAELAVLDGRSGRTLAVRGVAGVVDAEWSPLARRVALARSKDVLLLDPLSERAPTRVFAGTGGFDGIAWSPDGRWLLVGWPAADQWIFVRTGGPRRVRATSSITSQFDGSFPRIAGWCCAG